MVRSRRLPASMIRVMLTALGSIAAGEAMLAEVRAATGDKVPPVKVAAVRRVFHNGEHNAFTDLVRFQGKLYLTFRSCPDGHAVHPTASSHSC